MLKRTIGVSLVTGEDVEIFEEIRTVEAGVIPMQPPSRSAILHRMIFGPRTTTKETRHAAT